MAKRKIWIMNHYATNMFFNRGGRHYWFAENLLKNGFEPTIFCASTRHNLEETVAIPEGKYMRKVIEKIPFVFIKAARYRGSGRQRIKNMVGFSWNLYRMAAGYAKIYGRPEVILASSVHPLTLVAGIKIAAKLGVPCICEVRDLWPESLVAYGLLKPAGLLTKLLYRGEKWIYRRADALIMTWEGGKKYICDRGWEGQINLEKVKHINNGVPVEAFDRNSAEYVLADEDLENNDYKNLVYTGSIRRVNNLGVLLEAAKIIQEKGHKIRLLIYGSGDEKEALQRRCRAEDINNVIFKGRIAKKFVPSVLKRAHVNVLHNASTRLDKYGQSQNKLFEYLAAGRCIVQTYSTGYSIIERYSCGFCVAEQGAAEIARVLIAACTDEEENKVRGANARRAAYEYDFSKLTGKLIAVINGLEGECGDPVQKTGQ